MRIVICFTAGVFYFILSVLSYQAIAGASQIIIGANSADVGTIIIISPKTTDSSSSLGSALLNTIAGITDASAENPYLIKLGPGTYDVGTTGVTMKQWVSVEGSGEKATKITGSVSSAAFPPTAGTITGASNMEIRFLSVENSGTGAFTAAILNSQASPSLIHVTATASGGTTQNYGIFNYDNSSPRMIFVTAQATGGENSTGVYLCLSPAIMSHIKATGMDATNNYGIMNSSSSFTLEDSTVEASGGTYAYGIVNISSSPLIRKTTISGTGGTYSFGLYTYISGTIKINDSSINGTTNSINNGSGVTTRVGNSQLEGGATFNQGTLTCAGVYDENYTFSQNTCP
ncbi:MAG: hypothetical protein C4582_01395 [Desulfobacteraceae bacterium]|jgi:hypothetical protein|nr:MAG: hypothetical protein C4582_01395 [Desulfobacteraceae bacterium]